MAPKKFLAIKENDLCTRCGACVGICPTGSLCLDENNYPIERNSCSQCNLCLKICPGIEVDFPGLTKKIFNAKHQIAEPLGEFKKILIGHAKNKKIRKNASSGGIVTQLLISLLEKKYINGAIVTISDPSEPWKAKPILVENKDEILESTQSKYVISPVNHVLRKLRKKNGKFAFVGLPCHVHAIRKLADLDPTLYKKISPIIGLYCNMTLETEVMSDILEICKISLPDLKKVNFRSGKWPGGIVADLKNGKNKKLHDCSIKNIVNILHKLYYPKRCLTCIDGSNEFADISVGDPWIKNKNGQYPYPNGSSIVIERTDVGKEILKIAKKDDVISLKKINEDFIDLNLLMMKKKRKNAFIRIEKLKKKKKSFPNYNSRITINYKDIFTKSLREFSLILGKSKLTRKSALRFALSPVGVAIMKLNIFLKKEKCIENDT